MPVVWQTWLAMGMINEKVNLDALVHHNVTLLQTSRYVIHPVVWPIYVIHHHPLADHRSMLIATRVHFALYECCTSDLCITQLYNDPSNQNTTGKHTSIVSD